jgi:hypothetical protein
LGKFGALWQGARLEPAIAAPADHAGQGLVVGSSQYFPRDAAPAKQAQAFDKTPDRTHAMIVRHQFLRLTGRHSTWRRAKPRHRLANPLPRGLRGQRFEKLLVLVPSITRIT